jgi:hypothetical protein
MAHDQILKRRIEMEDGRLTAEYLCHYMGWNRKCVAREEQACFHGR